jgi:Ca-activated chloride channel family protein
MTFIWPQLLWGLLAVPALLALGLRRAQQPADALPGLQRHGGPRGRRSRLPLWLLSAALASWVVAAARPTAVVLMPVAHETVILAIDASGSMRATDLSPNRLAAAQLAARRFIESQPRGTRIGLVGFAGTASVLQPPTERREEVLAAIERLQPQRGTAIGSAIVVALAAIFPQAGITLDSVPGPDTPSMNRIPRPPDSGLSQGVQGPGARRPPAPTEPLAPGSDDSAVIVLLTDGQSNTGPAPIAAARLAAERGIRIYTVGIGTARGELLKADGWSMRVALDEVGLKGVAELTRGEFFQASSSDELKRIYASLSSRLSAERKDMEIGAFLAAAGALLALIAAAVALRRTGRIV